MPAGRKPQLSVVIDNETGRRTKAVMEARKAGEVTGASSKLTPPRELSGVAKKEWRRVVKLYRQLDAEVINDLDVNLLAAYCENVAIFKEAETAYQKEPLAKWDSEGQKWVESPYLKIMDGAAKNIMKAAEQLCLSPVGRARMGVLAAKKAAGKSPMARYLESRRTST